MQKFKNIGEYLLLRGFFGILRLFPLDAASYIGGLLARLIGPYLRAHRIAERNLSLVFPDMESSKSKQILRDMWDNLGRVAAELPHLPSTEIYRHVIMKGLENLPDDNRPAIYFSGHIGNWELNYALAYQRGIPITMIYRKANNPYVDEFIARIRATQSSSMAPKGSAGVGTIARAIRKKNSLALLIDQKMNNGVAVPFLGHEAMTAPAIAELALRYDMPIIPARVIRTRGAHFEAEIFPALNFIRTGNDTHDIMTIMTLVNAHVESWVRQYPAQWFWVHQRWPK